MYHSREKSLFSLKLKILISPNHVTGTQELIASSTTVWTGIVLHSPVFSANKFKSSTVNSLQKSSFLISLQRCKSLQEFLLKKLKTCTGDVHNAVYDLTKNDMYVAVASPHGADSKEGSKALFQRQ